MSAAACSRETQLAKRRAAAKLAAMRRKAIDDGYGPGGRKQGCESHKVESVADVLFRLRMRMANNALVANGHPTVEELIS